MSRLFRYVAVIGSRTATERQVRRAFDNLDPRKDVIVSGGAGGADTFAKQYAFARGHHYVEVPAIWARGKLAGIDRNTVIIDIADHVIAVWDGESRGTANSVRKAEAKGIEVEVIW